MPFGLLLQIPPDALNRLRRIAEVYQRGHSLIVYQHWPRRDRKLVVGDLIEQFRDRVNAMKVTVFSTPHVGFFLAAQPNHVAVFDAASALVRKRWTGQIKVAGPAA